MDDESQRTDVETEIETRCEQLTVEWAENEVNLTELCITETKLGIKST